VKGLKAQCNSLADAAQSEKFELLAAKQENERLQDQIVQVGDREILGVDGNLWCWGEGGLDNCMVLVCWCSG
jgi:hypothetical protein